MSILIDSTDLPERGKVQIKLDMTAVIHISAEEARKKVGGGVGNEIADLLSADTADLVWVSEEAFWRVPVVLSSSSMGRIGRVGALDVSVESGDILATKEAIGEIEENAERFAAGAAL